ncbi:uncharacterized protein Tco025E_06647, partial [Trypanosoma conorhini]
RVQPQRPHKKRPREDREAGAAEPMPRIPRRDVCAECPRRPSTRRHRAHTPGDHVGRVRGRGRAGGTQNHAVVHEQLVFEGAPERCFPARPDNPNSVLGVGGARALF